MSDNLIEIFYLKNDVIHSVLASKNVLMRDFDYDYEDYLKRGLLDSDEVEVFNVKPFVKEKTEQKKFSDGTISVGSYSKKETEKHTIERRAKFSKSHERLSRLFGENDKK